MPARTSLAAATVAALVLVWVSLAMKSNIGEAKPSAPRQVSVRLLGSATDITGAAVPSHVLVAKRGTEFFQTDGPSVVAVALPGGTVISLPVRSAFVTTEVDVRSKTPVVVDVALLPLSKAVTYREAVAAVRRLMRQMGLEPDDRMRKQMAKWPDDSGPITYRAAMNVSEDYWFVAEVRPALDPEDRWFVVFTFAAGLDARRVLWDPAYKAMPKHPAK